MNMKKALCLMVLVAALLAFGASVALAEAVVIKDLSCLLYDGNGAITFTTQSQSVGTPSANGNAMLSCHAVVPNDTGKAAHFDYESTGVECITIFGSTQNWKETVSASGQATLSCKYKNP
jgi:hypothetical protein